jgi:hypothetical protein
MTSIKAQIPTVSVKPWLDGSDRDSVVAQVRSACMTYGFFNLVEHGVPLTMQCKAFECARKFFSLPLAQKILLTKDPRTGRGYEGVGSQALQAGAMPDQKEARPSSFLPNMRGLTVMGRQCALGETFNLTTQNMALTFTGQITGQISQRTTLERQSWNIVSI